MKFTVIRSRFLELMANVQSLVPVKPSLQILMNAMFDATEDNTLTLTATDLDMTVRASMSTDVKVDEPGRTTLPVRRIIEILRMAPEGEVTFEIDHDNIARVVTCAAKYRVIGLDVREYPAIAEPEEETRAFTMDRAVFREMLRKISYAASTDETRRMLTGVLMKFADSKLTMVATDSKRLALVEQEIEFPEENACEMILPPKAVSELSRLLSGEGPMTIYAQGNKLMIACDSLRFYSKLIEGTYAKYQTVIPTMCEERVSVGREELISSIQRVSIMSNNKILAVRLNWTEGALNLMSSNVETGEANDVIPIKYSGEEFCATYNPTYILECLKNLDSDEVIFELSKGHAPTVIKCEGLPFLYVIMPLRLPSQA
ncbi:MAG: DNA polymerase III subunit beta [bacterium]|nr:DNA polymerase III subunit beta [bacterium]